MPITIRCRADGGGDGELPAWAANLGKRLVKAPKLFMVDTGLACRLLGMDAGRLRQEGEIAGRLFENFVVLELFKHASWTVDPVHLHHFRSQTGQEVDLVLEDRPGDKQREFLQRVSKNSRLLLHLVNDILDLSKIEASQMQVASVPVCIDRIFHETSSNAQTLIMQAGRHIVLQENRSPDVAPVILGDPDRLQQIMNNLISNAVKFTPEGCIEYGVLLKDSSTLLFYVKDSGIGIPQDKLDIIFESFQQVDMSTTRKFGGTGLGLTITRKFIELMGGAIWAESEQGRGTTFSFTLPYVLSGEQLTEEATACGAAFPARGGRRVLLVEDSLDNQMLLERILTKNGYTVIIANNGGEAVAAYKQQYREIDIILMDMQMPVMGGIEATQAIRRYEEQEHTGRIPLVALTAGAMKGDREQCLAAGCDSYLTKPVDKQKLLETIRHYTEQKVLT